MSDKTKAVNLTETEISYVLSKYGVKMAQQNFDDNDVERINYLNKRLKAFKEPETETQSKPENASGWGTDNG